jgi:ABC-type spermidine/putrescine transport system permease subunit II
MAPIAIAVVVAAVWNDKLQLHQAALVSCCLAIVTTLALAVAATAAALIEKKRSD